MRFFSISNEWKKKAFSLNRNLHRDVGYLCVVMVAIYAISGIAVNHIDSWNPSYVILRSEVHIPVDAKESVDEPFEVFLAKKLHIEEDYLSQISDFSDRTFFYQGVRVEWNSETRIAKMERTEKRSGFFFVNFLHLNKAKKIWTWVADIFAVLLLYLAISGLFMVKGVNSFRRRGWIFGLLGLLTPVACYFYLVS